MIKRLKDKRGVSMAEMIIAMTIITLVTAAAMTIMISSLRTTNRDFSEAEDQNFTSNAVACFTAAGSVDEFTKYMKEDFGYATLNDEVPENPTDAVRYHLSGDQIALVFASYGAGGSGTLTIGIFESISAENPIDTVTFQKGAR